MWKKAVAFNMLFGWNSICFLKCLINDALSSSKFKMSRVGMINEL
jgi:hypothetical protein